MKIVSSYGYILIPAIHGIFKRQERVPKVRDLAGAMRVAKGFFVPDSEYGAQTWGRQGASRHIFSEEGRWREVAQDLSRLATVGQKHFDRLSPVPKNIPN